MTRMMKNLETLNVKLNNIFPVTVRRLAQRDAATTWLAAITSNVISSSATSIDATFTCYKFRSIRKIAVGLGPMISNN